MSWSRLREILTLHRRTWQMWVLWKEPDINHLKNVTEFSVIFHWEEFSLPQMGKTWPLSTTSMLKRGPPVWKLGLLLLRDGGHGSPPLPPQPTADQKNTGVLLSWILCSGLCLSSLPGAPISLSDINTTSQFSRREVWMKSLGPLEWFVDYLLGWLGSLWESKASQLMAVKPC